MEDPILRVRRVLEDKNMNIRELFDVFNDSSETLSNQVRYINYGLIAVVWIISGQELASLSSYYCILLFIVASLGLDIFQYIWKSLNVWFFARCKEKYEQKNKTESDEYEFPLYIPIGTWCFFILKIISSFIAAVLLAKQLIHYWTII